MKVKTLVNIIFTILVMVTVSVDANEVETEENTRSTIDTNYASYARMSTTELQEAIEELSINGEYPLETGMELFKRWSTDS
jgi:hypothetical protein